MVNSTTMDLKTYLATKDGEFARTGAEFIRVAADAGMSAGTLYQIALGHKRAGPRLCVQIERATSGAVTRHDLRPDLFDPPAERAA